MSERVTGTFLGIDYGKRRIGLSRSDPSGLIASSLVTLEIRSMSDAVKQVQRIIEENHPDGLVIGYPLLASGDRSEICDDVDRFVSRLRECYGGPIHCVYEQYTSSEAERIIHEHGKRIGANKGRIDRLAAVILLQRYLDGTL